MEITVNGDGDILNTSILMKNKITVENHALGGTSSRTFYNRLWPDVLKGVRKGDWVIIELGHNDNGPYDSGRARASIPGIWQRQSECDY